MGQRGMGCAKDPVPGLPPMATHQLLDDGPSRGVRHAVSKVPEVTVYFWIIKVLTTGMGETASDFLAHLLGPVPAVGLGALALVAAPGRPVRRPPVRRLGLLDRRSSWSASSAPWPPTSCTSASASRTLISTPFFLLALGGGLRPLVRAARRRCPSTASTPGAARLFYWATVLATFALGTAAGDLTATTLGLGYLGSGVMFAVVIAVPAVAHRRFGLDAVAAFWSAYIVTRPLGASFADWMAVSSARGGLAWGWGRSPCTGRSRSWLRRLPRGDPQGRRVGTSAARSRDACAMLRKPRPGPGTVRRRELPAPAPPGPADPVTALGPVVWISVASRALAPALAALSSVNQRARTRRIA